MNNYWNANVLCPYYLRTGSKRIYCEWAGKGEIMQAFDEKRKMEEYLITHCATYDYKKCAFCAMNDAYYHQNKGEKRGKKGKERVVL